MGNSCVVGLVRIVVGLVWRLCGDRDVGGWLISELAGVRLSLRERLFGGALASSWASLRLVTLSLSLGAWRPRFSCFSNGLTPLFLIKGCVSAGIPHMTLMTIEDISFLVLLSPYSLIFRESSAWLHVYAACLFRPFRTDQSSDPKLSLCSVLRCKPYLCHHGVSDSCFSRSCFSQRSVPGYLPFLVNPSVSCQGETSLL